jgi:hypothetical protein
MSRTKGSGWGGGIILYQIGPECGKKKAMYVGGNEGSPFKCTPCKEYFNSNILIRKTFK